MLYNRKGKLETWEAGEWSKGKASCPKEPAEEGEIVSIKLKTGYAIAVGNGNPDPKSWYAVKLDKTLGQIL
jgi:hypothetical protein